MTTTHEPTYVTAMHVRQQTLDRAVLGAVRKHGPICATHLMQAMGVNKPQTVKASLYRLRSAGLVTSAEYYRNPGGYTVLWRAVEKA